MKDTQENIMDNQGKSNKQIEDALLFSSISFIGALITLIVTIFV